MDRAEPHPAAQPSTPSLMASLVLSCHPLPTLAVTSMAAGLAALAGDGLTTAVLLAATILTGQLSIGWSNDWLDAARDRANSRADKPAALGTISAAVLARAAGAAATLTVAGSMALGVRAGAAALVIVACGWAYNLGLKTTAWSWLPYAIAFGTLPAVATLTAAPSRWPAWWAIAAGALLGVAAHLANVLPDLIEDQRTGVHGWPHRIGQRATALSGPALMTMATFIVVFGPPGSVSWAGWLAVTTALVVGSCAATTGWRDPHSKVYFLATVGIAVLDLALFAVSGGKLT